MKTKEKTPTFKVKVDFNTWLEFPEGTTKLQQETRIEAFQTRRGKYTHDDPTKHPKS
jgi:hypothetical protein